MSVRRTGPVAPLGMIGGALLGPAAAGATSASDPCPAGAHHVDAAHDGSSACTQISPAASKKWTVTLNGPASYPVIGSGKIFLTTSQPGGSYGGWLYALNASDGSVAWGPVPLAGTYYYFPLALDGRRVFVNNFDGTIVAFNATTGRQLWAKDTDYFSGEPVAVDGVVYVHGSGSVFALSEVDGHLLWSSPYLDGDGSAIAVDRTGVYVNGGCSRFRLSLTDGSIMWSGNDGCTGGGGGISFLSNGRFLETTGHHVTKETTGKVHGSFNGIPAFSGPTGYFASGTSVFAQDVTTLTPRFTKTVPSAIVAGPVIANGIVFVGTADSKVYELSTTDGSIVGSMKLPGVPGGGGQYSGAPSDMNLGGNLLVVPTGAKVTAFG